MKTAFSGPLIVYGDRPPPGTGVTGSNNPDKAPSVFWGGTALLDPRGSYNNTRSGTVGFAGGTGDIVVLDAVPSTLSAGVTTMAAAQVPVAGTPLTLVTTSGLGITVQAAATVYWPSGNTVPAGALIIDSAPATTGFGRAGQGNSSQNVVKLYDPTTLLARNVRVKSAGSDVGATFTVAGYDIYGYPMSEAITGAGAGSTASGKKAFKFVTSITPSGTLSGSNVSAAPGDVYGFPLQNQGWPFISIFWGAPPATGISSTTGWTGAVTTSPATTTTGDVRGTYATQTASDGTNRLTILVTMPVALLANANPAVGLFGVTQV